MTVYGSIIAIAVFLGFGLSRRRASRFGISRKDIESLFLVCTPFAIIGARTYHVLSEFSFYQKNLGEALYFWQGGWGIFGAIFGGIIGIFLYTRFRKINFWKILNLLAPSLVLGQTIGRIGNIVNGELLPYAIYESAFDFLIFLFFTFNFSLFNLRYNLRSWTIFVRVFTKRTGSLTGIEVKPDCKCNYGSFWQFFSCPK